MYSTRQEAKDAGWFSRRHRSRDAHDKARETYKAAHGKKARQTRAKGK